MTGFCQWHVGRSDEPLFLAQLMKSSHKLPFSFPIFWMMDRRPGPGGGWRHEKEAAWVFE